MTASNPVPETGVESNSNRQLLPETEYVERTDVVSPLFALAVGGVVLVVCSTGISLWEIPVEQ